MSGRRGSAGPALAAAALAALAVSCAPRRLELPDLDAGRRQARYRTALAAREARGAGVEGDVSVWVRGAAIRDLPGAKARLVLAGPDAFRLRVESTLGSALDLAARGDTVVAYVPGRRLAMTVESAADSLGVREPGALGYRLWSAAWRPPAAAWEAAAWEDTLLRLRWTEAGDTLAVRIGSDGLPAAADLALESGARFRAHYRAWSGTGGVKWPSRVEVVDANGRFEVVCRVHRVRFGAVPERRRLTVRLPERTGRLTPAELGRYLERLGED